VGLHAASVARTLRTTLVAPAFALFLCLFATQAGILVLSPILVEVAAGLDVSTAAAGQLRTVTGLVAGVTALLLGRVAGRLPLRDLLRAGAVLLALGSVASAAAPSFALLVAAQVPTGLAVAILLSGGIAGASEWVAPEARSRALAWALAGQATAWIVGMPVIGLVAETSWRLAFAVPVAASLVALGALSLCRAGPPTETVAGRGLVALLREPRVGAWALGEVLAFSAWAGTLVYGGALFVESYGTTPAVTGLVLGAVAVAYLPGNFLFRRYVAGSAQRLLIWLALAAALGAALLGSVRPAVIVSAAIFGALAFVGAGRTLAGSAFGLDAAPARRLEVAGVRAAATQAGYLGGSAVGGVALAAGGYEWLGLTFAALFVAAALPHLLLAAAGRRDR
jgi:MFS transporter, DHA1 family, inner membrane transport protein